MSFVAEIIDGYNDARVLNPLWLGHVGFSDGWKGREHLREALRGGQAGVCGEGEKFRGERAGAEWKGRRGEGEGGGGAEVEEEEGADTAGRGGQVVRGEWG